MSSPPASPRLRRRFADPLAELDRRVTLAVRRLHAPGRDRVVHAITFLGSHTFLIPAALLACGTLLVARRPGAAFLGGAMLVGWTWSPLLKRRFRRGRPDLWAPLAMETSHSFPSGHATMATIFFGAAGMVLARLVPHPAGRLGILLAAALLILTVALSRVYLGVHWLSDVLAGILLGVVWLAVCLFVAGALSSRTSEPGADAPAQARWLKDTYSVCESRREAVT